MTVKELIALLSKADPDNEVVVEVEVTHDTVGASPSAGVVAAYNGFDWERGTFRLKTNSNLIKLNDHQMVEFKLMKKEARITRQKEWETRDKKLSFDETMELSKKGEYEKNVHPLFKTYGDKK